MKESQIWCFYFGNPAAETVFLGTLSRFQASFGNRIWRTGTREPDQGPEPGQGQQNLRL